MKTKKQILKENNLNKTKKGTIGREIKETFIEGAKTYDIWKDDKKFHQLKTNGLTRARFQLYKYETVIKLLKEYIKENEKNEVKK